MKIKSDEVGKSRLVGLLFCYGMLDLARRTVL